MSEDITARRHELVLHELNEERVAALRRIGRTLEALLMQTRASRDRIPHLRAADRARELARYREIRERALKYRWYLDVQREALGLRHHATVDEFYEVPAAMDV